MNTGFTPKWIGGKSAVGVVRYFLNCFDLHCFHLHVKQWIWSALIHSFIGELYNWYYTYVWSSLKSKFIYLFSRNWNTTKVLVFNHFIIVVRFCLSMLGHASKFHFSSGSSKFHNPAFKGNFRHVQTLRWFPSPKVQTDLFRDD